MFSKINKILEDININATPTKDASDKASIALYRKAYGDYREKRTDKTKYYFKGIQELLLVILGRSNFEKVKQRIQSDYSKDKLK